MDQETSFVNEDIPEETDEGDLDNQHAMHATENYEHGDVMNKDLVEGDKDTEADDLMNSEHENDKNYENGDTVNIPNGAGSILEDSIDTEEQQALGNAGIKSSTYTDDQHTNVDDDYEEHANADKPSFNNHSTEGYQHDATYLKDNTDKHDKHTNEGYATPDMMGYDKTKPVSHDSFEDESTKSPRDNFEQVTSAEMDYTEEVNYGGVIFSKANVGDDTSYAPNDGMDTSYASNDDEQAVSEEMKGLNCEDR